MEFSLVLVQANPGRTVSVSLSMGGGSGSLGPPFLTLEYCIIVPSKHFSFGPL
jgi:hypothetical protein